MTKKVNKEIGYNREIFLFLYSKSNTLRGMTTRYNLLDPHRYTTGKQVKR